MTSGMRSRTVFLSGSFGTEDLTLLIRQKEEEGQHA